MKWEPSGSGRNEILNCGEFFISYCFQTDSSLNRLVALVGALSGVSVETVPTETALCFKKDGRGMYYILKGDHRKAYEAAVKADGFGACMRYYQEHIAERDDHSTDRIDELDK